MIKKTDKQIAALIEKERKRQNNTIDLIPSENIVSKAVMEALGSSLTNKYSEGYPGKRYYAGNAVIDTIESLVHERARIAFGLSDRWHINTQALSGSPANMAAYYALLKQGDRILGMSLTFGGHLTHGWKVNFSGMLYKATQYTVKRNGYIDYAEVRALARKSKPKIIVAGATAYPRIIDFKKFADIAKEVDAYLMVDMAHLAGLVAAKVHPSPFSYADIVTTTTHKTLRGPRGALIFGNKDSKKAKKEGVKMGSAIDKAVFPTLQGGPHDNQTAAIAVALKEASSAKFKAYGAQVVKNAKALAKELTKLKYDLVSGGTDNHLMLVDLSNKDISGRIAQDRLEEAGIIVNRNTVPYDTRSPFDPSGIRIGTPSVTTRGMKEKDMKRIAILMDQAMMQHGNPAKDIKKLVKQFPIK